MTRRQTALLLVLILSVSSARMLTCGWTCDPSTPIGASEGCQHQPETSSLSVQGAGHPCDHDGETPVLGVFKTVEIERWRLEHNPAAIVPIPIGLVHRASGPVDTPPRGAPPHLPSPAVSVLRI